MFRSYHFLTKSKYYSIRDAAVTSFEVNGNFTADNSTALVVLPVVVNTCGYCNKAGTLPYFGKNCNAAICKASKNLYEVHKTMKVHEIDRQEDHITCSEHASEELKFMCECGDAICVNCVAVGHDGHKKTIPLEVAHKHRAELQQAASLLTRRADAVRAQAGKNVQEFDRDLKAGHAYIDLWKQELIDTIERQVKKAHAELDAKASQRLEALEAEQEATKQLMSRARSNDAVVQRMLEESSPLHMCTLTPSLMIAFAAIDEKILECEAAAAVRAELLEEGASAGGGGGGAEASAQAATAPAAIPAATSTPVKAAATVGGDGPAAPEGVGGAAKKGQEQQPAKACERAVVVGALTLRLGEALARILAMGEEGEGEGDGGPQRLFLIEETAAVEPVTPVPPAPPVGSWGYCDEACQHYIDTSALAEQLTVAFEAITDNYIRFKLTNLALFLEALRSQAVRQNAEAAHQGLGAIRSMCDTFDGLHGSLNAAALGRAAPEVLWLMRLHPSLDRKGQRGGRV